MWMLSSCEAVIWVLCACLLIRYANFSFLQCEYKQAWIGNNWHRIVCHFGIILNLGLFSVGLGGIILAALYTRSRKRIWFSCRLWWRILTSLILVRAMAITVCDVVDVWNSFLVWRMHSTCLFWRQHLYNRARLTSFLRAASLSWCSPLSV